MSELDQRPPSYYPAPPAAIKPIPRWIWIVAAVLILAAGAGGFLAYKSIHKKWTANYAYINALHAQMAQGDDAGIFAQSDPAWKQQIGRDKSNHMFDFVRDQLGAPHSTSCTNQDVSTNVTDGTVLTLTFTTVFDKGTGTETLKLHKSNGVYRMLGYHIDSDQLTAIPPDIKAE